MVLILFICFVIFEIIYHNILGTFSFPFVKYEIDECSLL